MRTVQGDVLTHVCENITLDGNKQNDSFSCAPERTTQFCPVGDPGLDRH